MKKILVIDDDAQVRALLERFLKASNFEVLSAADGLEGLEKAQTFLPDCIVLDVNMPDMNGLELCAILKKEFSTRRVPILFLSGEGRMGPAEDALDKGGVGYLTKPINFDRLKDKLKHLLELHENIPFMMRFLQFACGLDPSKY